MYKKGRSDEEIIKNYLGEAKTEKLFEVLESTEIFDDEYTIEQKLEAMIAELRAGGGVKVRSVIEEVYWDWGDSKSEEEDEIERKPMTRIQKISAKALREELNRERVARVEEIWMKLMVSKNTATNIKNRRK